MKKLNNYSNSTLVGFENEDYFVFNNGIKNCNQLDVIWKNDNLFGRYLKINDKNLFYTSEKIFEISINNGSIINDYNYSIINTGINGLFVYKSNEFPPKLYYYNFSSLNLLNNEIVSNINLSKNNKLIYLSLNEIDFLPKNIINIIDYNGNSIWQHPFSFPPYLDGFETKKTTQVEQFIGIYKNELWVLFSNNRFLVLDIATGEELYQIENLKNNLQLEGLATGDVFLDEENKKIKILAYLYYIEIDLDTRKAEIKKTYTDGFVIGKGQFYEGDKYVYFNGSKDISTKKSIGNNITGILNTETTEIEWYYKIDEDEKFAFFVDKPQANKKYFGVRDSNDTLHLFDRE